MAYVVLIKINWLVCASLCHFLLLEEKQHVRWPADIAVLWLHYTHLLHILFDAGHGRILLESEVYSLYLF